MRNVAGKDGGGIYLSESQIEISGKSTIILNNTAQISGEECSLNPLQTYRSVLRMHPKNIS